jgi:hypothetical protein
MPSRASDGRGALTSGRPPFLMHVASNGCERRCGDRTPGCSGPPAVRCLHLTKRVATLYLSASRINNGCCWYYPEAESPGCPARARKFSVCIASRGMLDTYLVKEMRKETPWVSTLRWRLSARLSISRLGSPLVSSSTRSNSVRLRFRTGLWYDGMIGATACVDCMTLHWASPM